MKFKVKKKYGQHFLNDKKIVDKIVKIQNLSENNIIEIGPGFGSLTKSIMSENPKSLLVIEKDISLQNHLEKLNKTFAKKINLIFDDALRIDLSKITNHEKVILIANLPYNIATTLIINWLNYISFFKSIIVMVQKEVADRLTAKTSSSAYGRLSVLIQLHCNLKRQFDVEPKYFKPIPKVLSTVIEIIPKENVKFNYKPLDQLLRYSFFSRRKKIKNNLCKIYKNMNEVFLERKIDLNLRPQDISPETYLLLSKTLN